MSVRRNFDDVQLMHAHFRLPTPLYPTQLTPDLIEFRIKAIREEVQELEDAFKSGNLAEQIDALVDITVFVMGTAELAGFIWQPHWDEVMKKNMLKERVDNPSESKRGHGFDLKKPEGWTPPDHDQVFKDYYGDED